MESMKTAANAYQSVQIDAAVLGASPHELIAKLLSKALESIAKARTYMVSEDIIGKTQHIKIAISIIYDGLRSSLDMEAGGELAQRLDALYEYMGRRLIKAQADNDVAILDEVSSLLSEIKYGWDGIKDQI